MDSKEYIKSAIRTESKDLSKIYERLEKKSMVRILHAGLGVSTEAGELLDAIKKHVYYGKELDTTNLFEEMGDLFWYMAILADELGFNFEDIMKKNIEKLQARYGESFTESGACVRDLAKERDCLEKV